MTITLCLFHDHTPGREPSWASDLSTRCRLVAVHRRDWVRLGQLVDLPWLIDVQRLDGEAVALLRPYFVFAGSVPRLVAVDREDRRTSVQASALAATGVVRRPIEAASVLGLISGGVSRADASPYLEAVPPTERHTSERPASTKSCLPSGIASIVAAVDGAVAAFDRLAGAMIAGHPVVRDDWEGIACDVAAVLHRHRLEAWLDIVRRHHVGTYQHSLLVMAIAAGLGRSIGLPTADVEKLALGGLLHDIGKFQIPEAILNKPGRLTAAEFEVMRRHPRDGWAVLRSVEPPLDASVLDMVLHHHEHLEGSSYPDGLAGTEIAPLTRMLTVCDVYGALLERRSYRPPLPSPQARAIVEAMAEEGKLDRDMVRALADLDVGSFIARHARAGSPEPLDEERKEARR